MESILGTLEPSILPRPTNVEPTRFCPIPEPMKLEVLSPKPNAVLVAGSKPSIPRRPPNPTEISDQRRHGRI